jgi:copper chaperone CopZ
LTGKTCSVPNISCGLKVASVERELAALPDVDSVKAELERKLVTVVCDNAGVLAEVEKALRKIGYPPDA